MIIFAWQELQENLLVYVAQKVLTENITDLKLLKRNLKPPKLPLKRIPFEKAKKLATDLLAKQKIEEPAGDLSTPGETALSNHFADPFFITEFPTELRGIYYESKLYCL